MALSLQKIREDGISQTKVLELPAVELGVLQMKIPGLREKKQCGRMAPQGDMLVVWIQAPQGQGIEYLEDPEHSGLCPCWRWTRDIQVRNVEGRKEPALTEFRA